MSRRGLKINYCEVRLQDSVISSATRPKEDVFYLERSQSQLSSSSGTLETESSTLETLRKGTLRLCVLSDSHSEHERLGTLPPCDVLIHAGDILLKSRHYSIPAGLQKLKAFNEWFASQPATYRIIIGGNHDIILLNLTAPNTDCDYKKHAEYIQKTVFPGSIYLCNSSVKLFNDTFTVVGSPMSMGRGSSNNAFQDRKFMEHTYAYFHALAAAKTRVDLLITHGPCDDIGLMVRPTLAHVYGHIHEYYGVEKIFQRIENEASNPHILEYRRKIRKSIKEGMSVAPDDGTADGAMEIVNYEGAAAGSTAGQDRYVFWHRIAASIMDEDFDPNQLPIVMDFCTDPKS